MPSLPQPGTFARNRILPYIAALVFAFLALLLRLVFWPVLGEGVLYSFFFLAVVGAAMYGGVGPAIVATLLSGLLVDYFLLPPLHSFFLHDARAFAGLGAFMIVCLSITILAERQRRSSAQLANSLSEQKLTEKALLDSEQRLRLAHSAANLATWEWDVNTGEITWSDGVPPLAGLAADAGELNRNWADLIHPDDRPILHNALQNAVEGKRPYRVEFRLMQPDGQVRWIAARGQALLDAAGKAQRIVGVGVEITERKRAEQVLVESERKFRAIAETAGTAIYIHDGSRFLFLNKAAEDITGYSRDELLQLGLFELVHPEDRAMVQERAVARFRGDQSAPARYEYRIINRQGATRWLDFSGVIVEFEGRRAILATAFDITDRKFVEQANAASEARLAAIIGSAMDAIITVDEQERVLVFNSAAERMFGVPAASAIGKPLGMFIPQRFRGVHHEHLGHFATDDDATRTMNVAGERLAVRANGEEFPIEATISKIESGGQRLFTVILRDVTDKKRSEEALIRSEKLASAGRLAASIAHEINNPLEAVTNLLFLARRDPSLAADSQKYLELADAELRRVAHIARQTLGFYRESTSPLRFCPPELVDNVVELLGQKIEAKRVQIVRDYRCQDEVLGFAGEIRQVISNLLTNALDALPNGGTIRLRITRAHDRQQRPGVRVAVADTGQGITPEQRVQIFEPFFTTKEHAGTGLGLWVTREIVAKHGGTIRVRSRVGNGTVFTVFLPCEPAFPDVDLRRAHALAGNP